MFLKDILIKEFVEFYNNSQNAKAMKEEFD